MADRRRKQASDTAGGGNRAFTLLELVVAVAVISVMVLGFGGLLGGARRVVITSQRRMRANAAAAAIAGVIRNDMRRASKMGFLRIAGGSLIFTTAGPTPSVLTVHKGDGAMISYGRYAADNILFRQAWVLRDKLVEEEAYVNTPEDRAKLGLDCWANWIDGHWELLNFAELQIKSADEMGTLIGAVAGKPPNNDTVGSPPETLNHLTGMWQVLADNCSALAIDYRSAGGGWTSGSQTWTRHDQTNWPDAVRFKLTITTGAVVEILEETNTYEVICPVGP